MFNSILFQNEQEEAALSEKFGVRGTHFLAEPNGQQLSEMTKLFEEGKLKVCHVWPNFSVVAVSLC